MRRALVRPVGAVVVALALLPGTAVLSLSSAEVKEGPGASAPHPQGPRYVTDEVVVGYRKGAASADRRRARSRVHGTAVSSLGSDVETLRLPQGADVASAAKSLRGDPSVRFAEPNFILRAFSLPNDDSLSQQWGLSNTSAWGLGTLGADIDAPTAWNVTTGSPQVTVAVADSGVDLQHLDLKNQLVAGWDFVGRDATPQDTDGHGTHVAGIIAAQAGNAYDVSGEAPGVKIMPLRVLGTDGSGSTDDIAAAFAYAGNHGVKIVNASFGGPDFSQALYETIKNYPNTLFVVAAGNDAANVDATPTYPCAFNLANVLCVAATDENDTLSSFSNYGRTSVDLAAPGQDILSTLIAKPAAKTGTNALTDSPNGLYKNNANSWVRTSVPLDLSSGCRVSAAVSAESEPGYDVVRFEVSDDLQNWTSLGSFAGYDTAWRTLDAAVPALPDLSHVYMRIRLRSDSILAFDGAYIDDLAVKCAGNTIFSDRFESGLGQWTAGTDNPSVLSTWATTSKAYTLGYMSGTSMATPFVSGAAALVWSLDPMANVAHVKNVLLGSVDPKTSLATKLVSGGRLDVARALQATPDLAPPTGVGMTGSALGSAFQRGKSFSVGWTATDAGTGVKSYDVRWQGAPYTGGFGSWVSWRNSVSYTGSSIIGSPGSTYCFDVRARDMVLNLSGWSPARCTALPLDDRSLTASGGWLRRSNASTYLGTYSYTTLHNTSLTLKNVRFKRLALIATTCAGCGLVNVYFGSSLVKQLNLAASSTAHQQVLWIRSYPSLAGPITVTLKVASSGKPVWIDGLGIGEA